MKKFDDLKLGDSFWIVLGVYETEPYKCTILEISESDIKELNYYSRHIRFEYTQKIYTGALKRQERTITLSRSLLKLNKIEDDCQFFFKRYYLNKKDAMKYIHHNEVYYQTKPNDYFDRMNFYTSFVKWHHMYSISAHGYTLDDIHAKKIIDLGVRAIPYLEEILQEDSVPHVNMLLEEIRKNVENEINTKNNKDVND